MGVSRHGGPADTQSETFGIRTITTRLIGASPIAPHGSRQFLVNGRPILFRGGGWSEDLFLHYSAADTANQIALIKNLGLNGIRTEGKEMPADFYEQMDRAGILVDAGFQCCDAWELPGDGKGVTAHDYRVLANSALAIGRELRNHPSILNFSWSDNNPIPRQAAVSIAAFRRADFQEPLIASAEYKSAPGLGPSGEKEGPYDWVPPSYWYDTSHYAPSDGSRTNVGGAWAFDSEASAGATIPTLDSIDRFLSPFEQTQLWKAPNYNQYHLNYEPGLPGPSNGGYSFGTLHDLDRAMRARYGPWSSLSQYVSEAQLANYETQRAEFEAYVDHSSRAKAPSTGIVYWQLNKGWPTLLWDLYNNDYDQAGSYFGAQEANKPLHVIYAYGAGTVSVANVAGAPATGLAVESRVFSVAGKLLDDRTAPSVAVGPGRVRENVLRPAVPAAHQAPGQGADLLRRVAPATRRAGGGSQRVLALHPARRRQLVQDHRPAAGDDDLVRGPARTPPAGSGSGERDRPHLRRRQRRRDRRHHRQHLRHAGARVLPPRRRAAGQHRRSPVAGRRRGAAGVVVRQRHDPVAGRVRDAPGPLRRGGAARGRARDHGVGRERFRAARAGALKWSAGRAAHAGARMCSGRYPDLERFQITDTLGR